MAVGCHDRKFTAVQPLGNQGYTLHKHNSGHPAVGFWFEKDDHIVAVGGSWTSRYPYYNVRPP